MAKLKDFLTPSTAEKPLEVAGVPVVDPDNAVPVGVVEMQG